MRAGQAGRGGPGCGQVGVRNSEWRIVTLPDRYSIPDKNTVIASGHILTDILTQ